MIKVAIIVSSDSASRGEREDKSGKVIQEIMEAKGYETLPIIILPDDYDMLKEELKNICDNEISNLILTTGGTGFSKRDVMPEVTDSITERKVPGIPEAMRNFSMKFTKRAMLSRASAGIRKNTLIINLPGSPKAVRECLEYIVDEVQHGLEILLGLSKNCARK